MTTKTTKQPTNDINIAYSVIGTLIRATGSFLTKCAAQHPNEDSTITFDVRYPGERLPSWITPTNYTEPLNLNTTPVYLSISRADMNIEMSMFDGCYQIRARHGDKRYVALTSAGYGPTPKTFGDKSALQDIQNDKEFAQYLSFVRQSDIAKAAQERPPQWDLTKTFEESRHSR